MNHGSHVKSALLGTGIPRHQVIQHGETGLAHEAILSQHALLIAIVEPPNVYTSPSLTGLGA